jgi:CelD/BcsL family acetyltransferase involved in cellulose biosynthesis
VIDALIEQKLAWAKALRDTSYLDSPAAAAFIRVVAGSFAERGMLHLAALRAGDRFVACTLGYARDGTLYGSIVSRDPAWDGYSPGQLLMARLAMWCCDHGIARFDMLCNDYGYKSRLGCEPSPLLTYGLPRSLRGRAALAAWQARKALRDRGLRALLGAVLRPGEGAKGGG